MLDPMASAYFAYGSNMSTTRLLERVPRAIPIGAARLAGFELIFDKPSRDGSAKANIVPVRSGCVWGVLWTIPTHAWPRLDRFEPDYARVACEPVRGVGETVAGETYVYSGPKTRAAPFRWYVAHLLAGAEEHALPEAYRRRLVDLHARLPADDTDRVP